MQTKTLTLLASWSLATLLMAPACGGSAGDASEDEGQGGSGAGFGIGGANGGGGTTPRSCSSTSDCSTGTICHPHALVCVAPGEDCESNEDCPTGSYCEPTLDSCLKGLPGSPCDEDENCDGATCQGGVCGCSGFTQEQETSSALDVYLIFDQTGSMGNDCEYEAGEEPPVNSKACRATYAMIDYLTGVAPEVDTRFALQFMSLEAACDAEPYSTPAIDLTPLPVELDDPLVEAIDAVTFQGGTGTRIEPALGGIAAFTSANVTEGREMIGVLFTDGDAEGCEEDPAELAEIIAAHREATGIRTFIIGMQGATLANLELMAVAGGAEPHDDFCGNHPTPCHFWSVGDGSGDAIANALTAIAEQAVPLACEYSLADVTPPAGQTLDPSTINVRLTEGTESTIIGQVASETACPSDRAAWYYDDPSAPTMIQLCENACSLVSGANAGARMSIVGGCAKTQVIR